MSTKDSGHYRIADNRIAELSEWDPELLRLEIGDLSDFDIAGDLDFDLTLTGFDTPQLDVILGDIEEPEGKDVETVDLPDPAVPAVTRPGDLWHLGPHRILCGDALEPENHDRVMAGETARMVFTDPPYNVPVEGHLRLSSSIGRRSSWKPRS